MDDPARLERRVVAERQQTEAKEPRGGDGRTVCIRAVLAALADDVAEPDQGKRRQIDDADEQHDREACLADARSFEVEQSPDADADEGRRCEESPQADACDRRRGHEHDREVAEEGPVIRRVRRDEDRRDQRAEQPEPGERLTVDERHHDGCDPDHAKQNERRRRSDEAVDAVRRIDRGEQRECAGRRQDGGNKGADLAFYRHLEPGAADEFTAGQKQKAENHGHDQPRGGTEEACLDGIAHQKDAAERQRQSADPDGPAGAERGFHVTLRPWRHEGGGRRTAGSLGDRRVRCYRLDRRGSCRSRGFRRRHVEQRGLGRLQWRRLHGGGRLMRNLLRPGFGQGGRLTGVGDVPRRLRTRMLAGQHEGQQRLMLALHACETHVEPDRRGNKRHDQDQSDETLEHGTPPPVRF